MYMYYIYEYIGTFLFIASQMWLLGRSLPAMVGHLVPEEDEHWQNLMLLLRIVDYLLAPRLTPDEADYVQVLIGDHHTMYKSLYPDGHLNFITWSICQGSLKSKFIQCACNTFTTW